MAKEMFAALALATMAALFTPSPADSCSCLPPDLARSYNSADDVISVSILRARYRYAGALKAGKATYMGRAMRGFKGCLAQGDLVIIEAANSSAACGMFLRRGQTYLLTAQRTGETRAGYPIIRINSCGYNVPIDTLTPADWEFLETRLNCCGEKCACNGGMPEVLCFADPCQVSPPCDVPGAQCVANYCGGCNAEWYDETGALVCTDECLDDTDCSTGSWCRPDEQRVGRCVPLVGPGERCNGFVLPWTRERCTEGLTCVPVEPTGDAPGICASCNVYGTPYQAGETFPAGDGCNTCTCLEGGAVACTKMACSAYCEYGGQIYKVGDSFPAGDGCNTCTCSEGGMVACTKIACIAYCEYGGQIYKVGDSFPADDGCNQCQCLADGTVACTEKACPPVCVYGGQTYKVGASFPSDDGCNVCACLEDGRVVCTMRACVEL